MTIFIKPVPKDLIFQLTNLQINVIIIWILKHELFWNEVSKSYCSNYSLCSQENLMVVSLFPEQISLLDDTLHAPLPSGTPIKAVVKIQIIWESKLSVWRPITSASLHPSSISLTNFLSCNFIKIIGWKEVESSKLILDCSKGVSFIRSKKCVRNVIIKWKLVPGSSAESQPEV